jgi:hypothetical protein
VDGEGIWPVHESPPGGHGYAVQSVWLFLQLVLVGGVSLRGVPRVMEILGRVLGVAMPVPYGTTGRLWLLRLGHAMLTQPLEAGEDWAWLIDHSVQIGPEKCLVILGIRLCKLPPAGQSLRHEDLHLLALLPASSWTRGEVDEALEQVALRGGVPRVIVNDHGADIHGGVVLFPQRHPQTAEIYDAKHKAACLLKHRLEKDPRWQEFHTLVGQTRCGVQQTELAFLVSPGPKPKARFMNLGPLLAWAMHLLAILGQGPVGVLRAVRPERLREKLGWIEAFAEDVARWSPWQEVIDVSVALIKERGIYHGVADLLAVEFSQLGTLGQSAQALAGELLGFVRDAEGQAKPGERFPGSTEVLESCFGKFKQLEKQQSRGGFTPLLLGLGALLADKAQATVQQALERSRTADVRRWAAETLGLTLFSKRRLAFASATNTG